MMLCADLLTPSTIACILAVLLVAASPVHHLMFEPVSNPLSSSPSAPAPSPVANLTEISPDGNVTCLPVAAPVAVAIERPPLQFIADTINSLGVVCVPVALMLLGSNLYSTVKGQLARVRLRRETSTGDSDDPLHAAPGSQPILPLPKRVLIGAVAGRLLILPVICFTISWGVLKIGLLPNDPLIAMVLVIEGCMPSAINLVILAQLHGDQLLVEQLSTVMLGQFIVCTFTIFTVIAVGLKVFV